MGTSSTGYRVLGTLCVALLWFVPSATGGARQQEDRAFKVEIPRCGSSDSGIISQLLVNSSPEGEYIDASQPTTAALCWTDDGLEVAFIAEERNTFSDADRCQVSKAFLLQMRPRDLFCTH